MDICQDMQELITSYLIQKRECNLPLLGHFRIKTKGADFAKDGKQIFPPTDEILYSEFAAKLSPDLITYISDWEHIPRDEAEKKIDSWCNYAKERLNLGEKIMFNSIGSLQKDAVGNIFFQRNNGFVFYEPALASVLDKNIEEPALAEGMETIELRNEFSRKVIRKHPRWKRWAIILLAIGLLVLVFYFYTHKSSETGIGNQASFPTAEPPVLHLP